jgi:tetratricopeptide (TPR) repeat protein
LRVAALVGFSISLTVFGFNKPSSADSTDMETPQDVIHLLADARYGEAVSAANDLLAQNPTDAVSYQIRGTVDLTVGDFALAKQDWQLAGEQFPHSPASLYGLALCSLAERSFPAAETLLMRARQWAQPDDPGLDAIDDALLYCRFECGQRDHLALPNRTDSPDPVRQEIVALDMARRDATAGRHLLEAWLATKSGAPRVCEENGIRLRIEDSGPAIEASPTDPAVSRMYLASLREQAHETAKRGGTAKLASDSVDFTAPTRFPNSTALVSFSVDGRIAGVINSRPYRYRLDTRSIPNGIHTVRIDALDRYGNVLASQSQLVHV